MKAGQPARRELARIRDAGREALRREGQSIEDTGFGGADGGIELILREGGDTALWRVDVKVVREMQS